ncbi:phosphatase PAP2 family protein, partial [bacterium]|nr:phosphatase PAP2 family protein [bacterium]
KKWDEEVLDGRRSFWSGHATEVSTVLPALSFYTWHHTGLERNARLAISGGLSAGIGFVGSSRIVDHRHHFGDVLAGFVVGTLSSTLVYRYQYGQWPYQNTKDGFGLILTHTSGMVSGWLMAKMFK